MKKIKIVIVGAMISVLTISGILSTVQPAKAIGVSPPAISAGSVHRDVGITKSVRVSRAVNEIGDIVLSAAFEGDYAHHFSGLESFIIPADEMGHQYEVTISPTDAATGDYEGRVVFYIAPDEEETAGNAKMYVIRGTAVGINYTVTGEELLAYDAINVRFEA